MSDILITHKNCVDGLACKAVFEEYYSYLGKEIKTIFCNYQDPPPYTQLGEDKGAIYIADFSFDLSTCEYLASLVEGRLLILDHHKTAKDRLGEYQKLIYDNDECGATLAWMHLFPTKSIPWFLKYVRDYDLYKFELPNSREINAFISQVAKAGNLRSFFKDGYITPERAVNYGGIILAAIREAAMHMAKSARDIELRGVHLMAVNASVFQNEVADCLKDLTEVVLIWHQTSTGGYKYSLRSNGNYDVTKLAKQFGGGGHKGSAGFYTAGLLPELVD